MSLTRYALRRLRSLVPTVLLVSAITFALAKAAPGDPFHLDIESAGPVTHTSPTEGLSQYATWLFNVVRGDFGRSAIDGQPVSSRVWQALPVTLVLAGSALGVSIVLALFLGVWLARRRGSRAERVVMALLAVSDAVPSFWVAVMALLLLATPTGIALFPLQGLPLDQGLGQLLQHLVLPMVCLGLPLSAFLVRGVTVTVGEALQSEWVRAARARGVSERAVVWRHAVRACAGQLTSLVALPLPHLVGGSVVIERVFGIRGMGLLAFEAVGQRDAPVILGVTMVLCVVTAVTLVLTDVLSARLDPRVASSLTP